MMQQVSILHSEGQISDAQLKEIADAGELSDAAAEADFQQALANVKARTA
jgi:hypothetical protein